MSSKNCFLQKVSLDELKSFLTGLPKLLLPKLYWVIAQSPEMIRKIRIFQKPLVFSICSSVHMDVSSEKIAESISRKILQDFFPNPRIKRKNRFFKRKSPKIFFWIRRLRFSTAPDVIHPNWEKDHLKIRFSSKVCPSTRRKQMWELYPVFFVQSQNLVKT